MKDLGRRAAIALIGTAAMGMRPRSLRAQDLTVVHVGASLDDGLTPLLYALHVGAFKAAGLDVQLQSSTNGAALAAAVAGGSVDFAKSSLLSLITAHARGVDFKIVAGAAQYLTVAPTTLLCVLATSNVKTLADLTGKTVAVSALQSLDQIGTEALVDKSGGDASTIKFIEVPFPAMMAVLEQGRADAASIGNPSLAAALASGKLRTFPDPYDGIAKRLLIAGWFTSADFAAKNPSVVDRFARVMRDANAYSNTHHAETAPILAEYAHLDPEVIAKMNRLNNAVTLDPQEIQPAIDAAAKYKFIGQPFPAKELLL